MLGSDHGDEAADADSNATDADDDVVDDVDIISSGADGPMHVSLF